MNLRERKRPEDAESALFFKWKAKVADSTEDKVLCPADGCEKLLFTNNETNAKKHFALHYSKNEVQSIIKASDTNITGSKRKSFITCYFDNESLEKSSIGMNEISLFNIMVDHF